MPSHPPSSLRRRAATASAVAAALALLAMAGCAGAPAAGTATPVGAISSLTANGTTDDPTGSAGTSEPADTRPAVTVPPLSDAEPSPAPTPSPAEPAASAPAASEPAASAPAASEPAASADGAPSTETPPVEVPPAEPPVEPAVPEAPQDTPQPAPAPALPELTEPYRHVLGFHGTARTVYLTFDDGPGPQTPAVLDILDAAGVKATFCQVGNRIADFPAVEQRVIADGHTLCDHSWDHPLHLGSADAAVVDAEIGRTQDAIAGAGASAHYFRAPGGDFGTTDTLRQVAQSHGVIPLGWGVDSLDWTKPGVDAIVANVLSAVSPGAIVLMHDAGGNDRDQTIAALPRIIDGLRAAGYDLQPLPPGGI